MRLQSSNRPSGIGRQQREGGYLLLAILFTMALMIIAATIEAPRLVEQIKRDREEEMIHRGTEYARAVKKFYKKFGRYPANLEQLDDTNQIRFLRKRYKDPLTKDGKWKTLSYADIQSVVTNGQAGPGVPAGALGAQGGQNAGAAASPFGNTGFNSPAGGAQTPAVSSNGVFSNNSQTGQTTSAFAQQNAAGIVSALGGSASGNAAQGSNPQASQIGGTFSLGPNNSTAGNNANPGANSTANPAASAGGAVAGQTYGGGAIVGVASVSKDLTIRLFNKKKKYEEWMFIYDPTQDRNNILLRGPYQPMTLGGAQGQGIPGSTPASQMNGQQQQSPFGQGNSGFSQGNSGYGQGNSGAAQPQQPTQPQQ